MVSNYAKYLKEQIDGKSPSIGVVLGSGLNCISNALNNKVVIPYSEIPSFQNTSVKGHPGEFIVGDITNSEKSVIFANGRFHLYEGLAYNNTYMIIDIFKEIGCQAVIITNSSGCLDDSWAPGDLMIIDSHIDFTFRGSSEVEDKKSGNAYYNAYLTNLAESEMINNNIAYHFGTYGWTMGPTYETESEIKMMRNHHIKAVGMSTVPEINRAHELKLPLLAIACLTNYAVGISKNPLTHEEVVQEAEKAANKFSDVILSIIKKIRLPAINL